jgi:5-methylcytosine-specific restriction endonuclease McrA
MHEFECAKLLGNDELIFTLTRCVREDRELSARLLAQLGEVDARGLFRDQGFSSMFDYVVRALNMSESEADLRIKAARTAREFPIALEMLARGELHMTALRLLSPVLTSSNLSLLKEACFKSKSEVKELIAKHFPVPDVAESIRRLPQRHAPATHHEPQLPMLAHSGPAASASIAEQPAFQATSALAANSDSTTCAVPEPASSTMAPSQTASAHLHNAYTNTNARGVTDPLSEGRYKVVFTASQLLHDKLREARDLACDDVPTGELAKLVECAIDLLIAHKKRQRFAQTSRPRKQLVATAEARPTSMSVAEPSTPRVQPSLNERSTKMNRDTSPQQPAGQRLSPKREQTTSDTRYIPRALRREVYARDGGRCSFVSANGSRSRRDLEFHHIVPFAMGGLMTLDNLTLMCRAHNALLAERDYGRDFVKSRIANRPIRTVPQRTNQPGLDRTTP